MGVLPCSRTECENIMCDTHIPSIGYICFECQEEFKNYVKSIGKNENDLGENEISSLLKDFIKTPKGKYQKGAGLSIDNFFRKNSFGQ